MGLLLLCVVAAAGGSKDRGRAADRDRVDDRNDERDRDDGDDDRAADRVLVLDLGGDVDAEDRRSITALVARDIDRAGLEVVSGDDLRNLVALEGEKQAAGCAGDESCLAEIAGALDARLVVSGFVGRLGSLIVVNLSLFDARSARSHGRVTVEARDLEELPKKLEPAVAELVGDFLPQQRGNLGVVVGVAGGAGVVVGAGLAVAAGLLYLQHDGARTALLATSAAQEDDPDDARVVDLADQHEAVVSARTTYNQVGVPLWYGAAVVGVAGAVAVVVGVVVARQDAE